MLADRALPWKLFLAIALVVGACAWSHRRAEQINPSYWYCRLHAERLDGTLLWLPAVAIESRGPEGFRIDVPYFPDVPVTGRLSEEIGEGAVVGLTARFRKDGALELVDARPRRSVADVRHVMTGLSLVALAAVIAFFLRAFRVRWDRLALRRIDG